jgi:hypothetical protein
MFDPSLPSMLTSTGITRRMVSLPATADTPRRATYLKQCVEVIIQQRNAAAATPLSVLKGETTGTSD